MRASGSLVKVGLAGLARLNKLLAITRTLGRDELTGSDLRALSYVVIELQSLSSNFGRSYYLSSCTGAVDALGQRATTGIELNLHKDALARAISHRGKMSHGKLVVDTRFEPKWNVLRTTYDVLAYAQASTAPHWLTAMSGMADTDEKISTVRNFFAHRNEGTADRVRRLARDEFSSQIAHPAEFCRLVPPGGGVSVLEGWLVNYGLFIKYATRMRVPTN